MALVLYQNRPLDIGNKMRYVRKSFSPQKKRSCRRPPSGNPKRIGFCFWNGLTVQSKQGQVKVFLPLIAARFMTPQLPMVISEYISTRMMLYHSGCWQRTSGSGSHEEADKGVHGITVFINRFSSVWSRPRVILRDQLYKRAATTDACNYRPT